MVLLFAGSGGFLLRPTLPLCICDSLSSGGTHLAPLPNGWSGRLRGSITGQQSTGLFELGNLEINQSENLVYAHEPKYTEAISYRTRYPFHISD